jgi:hypothetical protein
MIKRILLLSTLLLGVVAPPTQIVTNPNEPDEYAEGVYCTPKGDNYKGVQTPDHPCACKNMMREDKDGCCDVRVTNDPVCKQYCSEKHCACPKQCIPGQADETEPPTENP